MALSLAVQRCLIFCLLLSSLLPLYLNCVLPPREPTDEVLRPGDHHSYGAAGGEPPEPLVERPEPRRSGGVVHFAPDVKSSD